MKMLAAVVLSAVVTVPAFAQSREYQGPPRQPASASQATDQIIVQWRSGAKSTLATSAVQRASKLSTSSGVGMAHKRRSSGNTEVYKLDRPMSGSELQGVLDRLNADPAVAFAVADKRRQIQQLPADPFIGDQWYFLSAEVSATRTDQAWDITTGDATVVAVLDTGVRYDHPDLAGKVLPGYDFVTNVLVANDGDGPDSDASDPGDWVTTAERTAPGVLNGCRADPSTWHGTRVSSLIGATTNEAMGPAGMAGMAWTTQILPVRVLGKCGGNDSDIIDGMRWAAGLPVEVPDPSVSSTATKIITNPTPAKIINMSLGGNDDCSAAYQNAVNEIIAQGSLIVASVGNEGIPVGTPANCAGVLGVSGVRHAGTKVGYSSLGTGADLAAPAGNCVNTTIVEPSQTNPQGVPCVYSLLVARDTGTTVPESPAYTNRFSQANFGTSFSAPLVAGAAALMNAVNPQLSPAQFTTLLQESSTPFPISSTSTTPVPICRVPTTFVQDQECICTTVTCGAGMLNTAAAVTAALKPFGIVQSTGTIDPNVAVNISGSTSFGAPGRTIASYQWSITNVTGAAPTITDPAAVSTTVQVSGNSRFTLQLRVTDDAGTTDDTQFAMVTSTPPEPPLGTTPIGTGGGGGGSFDWWLLVLGLLPLALPGPRRRKTARVRGRVNSRNTPSRELHEAVPSASRSHRRRRRQQFPQ